MAKMSFIIYFQKTSTILAFRTPCPTHMPAHTDDGTTGLGVGCGKIFCAPDQIGKTKTSGSVVPGSFKIFQNSFECVQ